MRECVNEGAVKIKTFFLEWITSSLLPSLPPPPSFLPLPRRLSCLRSWCDNPSVSLRLLRRDIRQPRTRYHRRSVIMKRWSQLSQLSLPSGYTQPTSPFFFQILPFLPFSFPFRCRYLHPRIMHAVQLHQGRLIAGAVQQQSSVDLGSV